MPEQRRPLRAVRPGVRRHRHLERRRLARARRSAATVASPTRRWRSPPPVRSRAPTTPSSSSSGIEDIALEQGVPEDEAADAAQGLPGVAERQRHHHGDGGLAERPRVRGLRLRRGGRRRGEGDRGRRRRRLRGADARDDLRRLVPAVALALHLREQRGGRATRGRGVRRLLPLRRSHGHRRAGRAGRATSPCRPIGSRPPAPPGSRRQPDRANHPVWGRTAYAVRPFSRLDTEG